MSKIGMFANPLPAAAAAAAAVAAARFAARAAAIHGTVKRPVSPSAATVSSHLPSACAAFKYPSARVLTERSSTVSCQAHFARSVSEESLSSGGTRRCEPRRQRPDARGRHRAVCVRETRRTLEWLGVRRIHLDQR